MAPATWQTPPHKPIGDFHREITTSSRDAQKYFDQDKALAFGFSHAESVRSFRAKFEIIWRKSDNQIDGSRI